LAHFDKNSLRQLGKENNLGILRLRLSLVRFLNPALSPDTRPTFLAAQGLTVQQSRAERRWCEAFLRALRFAARALAAQGRILYAGYGTTGKQVIKDADRPDTHVLNTCLVKTGIVRITNRFSGQAR
jgi:hypothetical protein